MERCSQSRSSKIRAAIPKFGAPKLELWFQSGSPEFGAAIPQLEPQSQNCGPKVGDLNSEQQSQWWSPKVRAGTPKSEPHCPLPSLSPSHRPEELQVQRWERDWGSGGGGWRHGEQPAGRLEFPGANQHRWASGPPPPPQHSRAGPGRGRQREGAAGRARSCGGPWPGAGL